MKAKMNLYGHFCHYYKNIPIKLSLGLVYSELEDGNYKGATREFKDLCKMIAKMRNPLKLVLSLRMVPSYTKLPQEVQKALQSFEQSMIALKEFFATEGKGCFEDLLKSQNREGLKEFIDNKLSSFYDQSVYAKMEELKIFPEKY